MKTFDFGQFKIVVRDMGFSGQEPLWRISLESRGLPPVVVHTVGAGPEEAVALSFLEEIRSVLLKGVDQYVSRAWLRGEDAKAVRHAAELMHMAGTALGESVLSAAEAVLREEFPVKSVPPPPPKKPEKVSQMSMEWAQEVFQKYLERDYDLSNFSAHVRVIGVSGMEGWVLFVSSISAPGVSYEERIASRTFIPAEVASGTVRRLLSTVGKDTAEIEREIAREGRVEVVAGSLAEAATLRKAATDAIGPINLQAALITLDRAADEEFEDQRRMEIEWTEKLIRDIDEQIAKLRRRRKE